MRKHTSAVFLLLFLFASHSVCAQEVHYDPLARNLIFVEGEAELTVPINAVDLEFGFDIDKSSFVEAEQESARIIEQITMNAASLKLGHVELLKGWDLVKQAKISLSTKGRKISNRLTLRITDFPEEKLHELIAAVIEKTLSVSGSIQLENVRVFVSEEIENQKKEEVVTEALKTLQSNALRAAQTLNRTLSAPKRVFVTSEAAVAAKEEDRFYDYSSGLQEGFLSRSKSPVSYQKSFKVQAQIVDHLKISAKVSGIYELS